jgi:beta-lactamase family protein
VRLVTLGVGAQKSPRYRPAGLLLVSAPVRIMIDGGPGAVPRGRLDAWLVTDERAELIAAIRRRAWAKGLRPYAGDFRRDGVQVECRRVTHTNHPTYGYRLRARGRIIVWAPEFHRFPAWAAGADVMFAEAAGWDHPIRFRGGVGGHLDVKAVAERARRLGVKRLVFAHIGRPTLRALSRGKKPPFGEMATDGQTFLIGSKRRARRPLRSRRRRRRSARGQRDSWERRPGRARS